MSDPKEPGYGGTTAGESPKDGAWQNELTEEDIPSPAARDDAARSQDLDPDIAPAPERTKDRA